MLTESIVRRRASPEDVVIRRAAAGALKPIAAKLPGWQREAAQLAALGEHGRYLSPSHVAAAEELVQAIEAAKAELAGHVATWPDKVALQSRVVDLQRALASAGAVAAMAHRLLTRPKDPRFRPAESLLPLRSSQPLHPEQR